MLKQNTPTNVETNNNPLAITGSHYAPAWQALKAHGFCILRDNTINIDSFGDIVRDMCSTVTLDPARSNSVNSVQKVDAGTDALGLHIENGNTPNAPELVFFYCRKAPLIGSRTTLCDGIQLLNSLPEDIRQLFSQKLYVTRTISEQHWKTYLASEHPQVNSHSQVTTEHLKQMLSAQDNIEGTLNTDGSLSYRLTIDPIIKSSLSSQYAFANAILGPSFSYQPPAYEFEDGRTIDDTLKSFLSALAENITTEIPWVSGDIAIIDNHRVMHGRREISNLSSRELFIGMGNI